MKIYLLILTYKTLKINESTLYFKIEKLGKKFKIRKFSDFLLTDNILNDIIIYNKRTDKLYLKKEEKKMLGFINRRYYYYFGYYI